MRRFTKDFTMVVIGQIISLFGNAAIRFALPLYLLNMTGSSALYGAVTACAFIPAIILSPFGGIVADRVNKRNIMVTLDFSTAGVLLAFMLLVGRADTILLITVTLMIMYGIAGAYQPSVQASIPALVAQEDFMAANAAINVVNSFASLIGPVIGGALYGAYGLKPVLVISTICFILSAIMEIFIKIPFKKPDEKGGVWNIIKSDFRESIHFIVKEKPIIGKILLAVCGINLFLSAMLIVGMPYIITEVLQLAQANSLCGFAQGAVAAGGLTGGILAGFIKKVTVEKSGNLITACALSVFPMGAAMALAHSGIVYAIMTVCCFAISVFSTIFTVHMMAFIQAETPQHLLGKVIAVILTVSMCAQPLGNAFYGVLFEICKGREFAVVFFGGIVSLAIAARARSIFRLQNS